MSVVAENMITRPLDGTPFALFPEIVSSPISRKPGMPRFLALPGQPTNKPRGTGKLGTANRLVVLIPAVHAESFV